MRPIYIKKNGKFLAYKDIVDESDYWEVSELNMQIKSGWYWTDDEEDAKTFIDTGVAEKILLRNKGEFWHGAKVVK